MDLLVLGGRQFVGRYIVEAALERGHRVFTFSRGKTNPGLFPQAEKLIGDRRAGDLEALRGRYWDAVVDVNGYLPREVRQSAELLEDRVGRYLFISTVSVYADPSNTAENGPVQKLDDPSVEEVTNATYGVASMLLKVLQEMRPEYAVAAFDTPVPTFRHLEFEAYKAHRGPAPEGLSEQLERVNELLEAMGIPTYRCDGFEADDLLGTLARQAREMGLDVVIVTGDTDALQL
ncbi:MAG: hypothetical protein K6T35_08860, partial [Meiothermus silvanus]|nr:hypothetical protein [Allomeiothermus silvanus]